MAGAKRGDAVEVHYTGRLDDGTVFDSSEGSTPLAFTLGQGEVIEGFDQGVMGMEVGEKKRIVIPAAQAYGEHQEGLVQTVTRDQIRLGVEPEVGMQIEMRTPDGTVIPLTISDLSESTVTLDANHPLAGEQLHFDVQLVEIK